MGKGGKIDERRNDPRDLGVPPRDTRVGDALVGGESKNPGVNIVAANVAGERGANITRAVASPGLKIPVPNSAPRDPLARFYSVLNGVDLKDLASPQLQPQVMYELTNMRNLNADQIDQMRNTLREYGSYLAPPVRRTLVETIARNLGVSAEAPEQRAIYDAMIAHVTRANEAAKNASEALDRTHQLFFAKDLDGARTAAREVVKYAEIAFAALEAARPFGVQIIEPAAFGGPTRGNNPYDISIDNALTNKYAIARARALTENPDPASSNAYTPLTYLGLGIESILRR
jgi:hypothetical protein